MPIKKLNTIMADGFSGLTIHQIELFRHIDLSLDGIKNVYESEMSQTVDKVDKKAQVLLASVDKIVHGWTRELRSPEMQRLAYEIKAVIHSLPVIDTRPKLTAFSPTFVAPSNRESNILIKCIGSFPVLSNSEVDLLFGSIKKNISLSTASLRSHFLFLCMSYFQWEEILRTG